MSKVRVVNKRTATAPEPHVIRVYIGRPSPLGNPFKVGVAGTRDQVIVKYRDHIQAQLADADSPASHELNRLKRLLADDPNRIIELECWCEPQSCHGDILRNLLVPPPKLTFALVDPPTPQPVENCRGHHRWVPVPTTHGVEPPKDQVHCEICWFIPQPDSWPELMRGFHRRLAIEQLMEYWHDLSEDEQHDWALDWLERSTDEQINSDCAEAFSDQ